MEGKVKKVRGDEDGGKTRKVAEERLRVCCSEIGEERWEKMERRLGKLRRTRWGKGGKEFRRTEEEEKDGGKMKRRLGRRGKEEREENGTGEGWMVARKARMVRKDAGARWKKDLREDGGGK